MSCSLHDSTVLPDPKVVQVGEGMFSNIQPEGSWWVNNTAFLVGRRGVVSIDSCATERRTRAYLDAIRGIAGGPVHTLVTPTTAATAPTATTCSRRRRSWPRSSAGRRCCATA